MKRQGLLFGLNYKHIPGAELKGCINDVNNMKKFLTLKGVNCKTYTDDTDLINTSGRGIINKLNEAVINSYKQNIEFLWIHFSGHGTSLADKSGDEKDKMDECIAPSDAHKNGVISDDMLNTIFKSFNPKTRVICVFDCCHSGTICDVKFSWDSQKNKTVENNNCKIRNKLITISGCKDDQCAMDVEECDILGNKKSGGALTSALLNVLNYDKSNNVFEIVDKLNSKIKEKGFAQVSELCSSYDLVSDGKFF